MRRAFAQLVIVLSLCGSTNAAAPADGEDGAARAGSCWPGPPGSDPRECTPDDPKYPRRWEFRSDIPPEVDRSRMHPAEVGLGSVGFSLDAAWQHTIGRDDVLIAVLDSGVLWDALDLVQKLYLNERELPLPQGAASYDKNGDGIFNVDDYIGDPRVRDANGNGALDPGDLIQAFSNCRDDDRNGYPDDISGYDLFGGTHCGFQGGDNDPGDDTRFGHGTGIASTAAAETNNGIEGAGVCPRCRVLPVRVGDSFVVDANQFARGVVFAVRAGASVIASALGSYNNTPAARAAVDFAYERGVVIAASAADEFSYHHNYPSVYPHTAYVNAIRFNHASDYRKGTTFWGVNPCTNFGARVSVTVPAENCSSGATSRLAGVLGLIESRARETGLSRLQAEEVYQVLRMTADDLDNTEPDWGSLLYPARRGFDQYYGYGRLNALTAVRTIEEKRIPPMVDLFNPEWFDLVSPRTDRALAISGSIRAPRARHATYELGYALGAEPADSEFHRVSGGTVAGAFEGPLGVLDFERLPLPSGPAPTRREERDRYSVTLRLSARDDTGLTAEARRSFFVFDDPAAKKHFPLALHTSGEGSPVVTDLDDDGRDEIVLAMADGYVRIVRWEEAGPRTIRVPLDRGAPLDPMGEASRGVEPVREGAIREAAVGDLFGDGRKAIVVASREGKVYAFSARGERLGGFPVSIRAELARPVSPTQGIESGILSTPVLADLDGRRGLEIVVSSLDGHVYAWRNDGTPVGGFPVPLVSPERGFAQRAKILSTPAVGDVDGDGRPEIVVGSNGLREGGSGAWAIRADGRRHPGGAFLPGWDPYEVSGIRPGLLPTLGTGVQMSPALVDVDGDRDLEAVLYAVSGDSILLVDHPRGGRPRIVATYSMSPGPASEFASTSFLASTGSPLVADTDGDGAPELYASLLPMRMVTLRSKPGVPLDVPTVVGGWVLRASPEGASRVPMIPTYPRRMEDLTILARPLAADVDGDGNQEVLMGSGGYLLHAFRLGGGEADGFPKFTGGWIFSAPAVGDLDGDGRMDLVTVTREGYLFAWDLASPSKGGRLRPTYGARH